MGSVLGYQAPLFRAFSPRWMSDVIRPLHIGATIRQIGLRRIIRSVPIFMLRSKVIERLQRRCGLLAISSVAKGLVIGIAGKPVVSDLWSQ